MPYKICTFLKCVEYRHSVINIAIILGLLFESPPWLCHKQRMVMIEILLLSPYITAQ